MAVICDRCGGRAATHKSSGADGWFLHYCDECHTPAPHGVVSAYRDAEGELIDVRHMECCACNHFWMERGCVISNKCKECGSRCVRTVEAYQEAI